MKHNANYARIAFLLMMCFPLAACDPGTHMNPKGWTRSNDFERTTEFERVLITTSGLFGLDHWDHDSTEFRILNKRSSPVLLESADLTAQGRTYEAVVLGIATPNQGWIRRIEPNIPARVEVKWNFGKPLREVYKESVTISLRLRIEGEIHTLEIRYPHGES